MKKLFFGLIFFVAFKSLAADSVERKSSCKLIENRSGLHCFISWCIRPGDGRKMCVPGTTIATYTSGSSGFVRGSFDKIEFKSASLPLYDDINQRYDFSISVLGSVFFIVQRRDGAVELFKHLSRSVIKQKVLLEPSEQDIYRDIDIMIEQNKKGKAVIKAVEDKESSQELNDLLNRLRVAFSSTS